MTAEIEQSGGISPRLSPVIDLPTASALIQRAGYNLPVVDVERIIMHYPGILTLMRDLRGMGETNAHVGRMKIATRKSFLAQAESLYPKANNNNGISATFDVIFIHGWKPIL
jgi:hypothetical protein